MSKPVDVRTAWVLPPLPTGGRDHLGVEAPCVSLYRQLLPGLTNTTDRARYYSFHPWLVSSFEQRYEDRSRQAFSRVLRRAECLFALVGLYHARALGERDEFMHGAAMVGRDELRHTMEPIFNGDSIVLETYADPDSENSYFKNKLGGLGQYYFGPLRDVRVLDYVDGNPRGPIGYDKERGAALARAFDEGVDASTFFEALEEGEVGADVLEGLVDFCPCRLASNLPERQELLDLFLARSERYAGDSASQRRTSLALVLDLVAREWSREEFDLERVFRGACYSGALPGGAPWTVVPGFRAIQRAWGTYQRNELLSVALQGLFWSLLHAVEDEYGGRIHDAAQGGSIAVELVKTAFGAGMLERTVADAVEWKTSELPVLHAWYDDQTHEVRRAWDLVASAGSREWTSDTVARVAVESIEVLLSLMARASESHPYGDFDVDSSTFSPAEVHLLSFRHYAEAIWPAWTVRRWVEWLGTQWGVERHLRVALRKLRGQSRDTFMIRPLDGELRLVAIPQPVFTSPRLGKAIQVLRDLGLLESGEAGWSITSSGVDELEACRG